LKILVGRSSRKLRCSCHIELDAGSGLGAAQLTRTAFRGLARSRMGASAPSLASTKFVSDTVREKFKICGREKNSASGGGKRELALLALEVLICLGSKKYDIGVVAVEIRSKWV
jgi:hypothetical protein